MVMTVFTKAYKPQAIRLLNAGKQQPSGMEPGLLLAVFGECG